MRVRSLCVLISVAVLGCSRPIRHVERLTLGDTAIVRTTGDGEWGPIRDAVEENRAGGDTSVAFGLVNSALVLPGGGALVFDAKALNGPVLELFDSTARFVTSIGREGSGPGEYALTMVVSLAAKADGTILVLDPRNQRIDRFAPDGRAVPPIRITGLNSNGGPELMRVGADGSVYVWSNVDQSHGLTYRQSTGYIHYDTAGVVIDTIPVQHTWFAADSPTPTDPHDRWSALGDGRVLMSRDDLLGFVIKPAVGNAGMMKAEIAGNPVRLEREERREIQAIVDAEPKEFNEDGSTVARIVIPDHKPAISGVMTDLDGRIWLQRNVASIKVPPHPMVGMPPTLLRSFDQPTVWSAFRVDGTYLGDVRFPIGIRIFGFSHDVAWAIVRDKDDQQLLVKYRIPGIGGKP